MMHVGHVRVFVGERRMQVRVRMWLRYRSSMFVLMMLVVTVHVVMEYGFVRVPMGVLFPNYRDYSQNHQRGAQNLGDRWHVAENRDRQYCAHERRGCEKRGFPRRAQQAKRLDVKNDAGAVAESAHHQGPYQSAPRRDRSIALCERNHGQARTGCRRLHAGDRHGIAQRDSLSEIVVDRPAQTGSRYFHRSSKAAAEMTRLKGDEGSSEHDGGGGESLAPPQMLTHQGNRDDERERVFEVEQKRSAQSRYALQSKEHQDGPRDSAKEDDPRDERQIASGNSRFAGIGRANQAISGQSRGGAYVQQGRQGQRRKVLEEELGCGCASPEQPRGAERVSDASGIHQTRKAEMPDPDNRIRLHRGRGGDCLR
jgi:hypothetical protein